MNFEDFARSRPRDLPSEVSPIYFELYSRVARRGGQDAAQIITFCVAYTLYSSRKKDTISNTRRDGGDVTRVFKQFDEEWILDATIDDSKDFLDKVVTELKAAGLVSVINEIKSLIQKPSPWWRRILSFFSSSFLHVSYLIVGTLIFILIFDVFKYVWPDLTRSFIELADHVAKVIDHVLAALRPP